MASEQPTPGRCNAPAWLDGDKEDPKGERSKTGYCQNYPSKGAETCQFHFGTADRDGIRGADEGNGNGLTHGATASPLNLYNHLDDEAVRWVDSLVAGYLEVAPFGYEDPRRERLTRVCVMIYQEWKAAREVMDHGPTVDKTVGVSDSGVEATQKSEHHLGTRERALNSKVRSNLKDLGLQPSSGDSAGDTVAQIFEAAVERAKREEGEGAETVEVDGGSVE